MPWVGLMVIGMPAPAREVISVTMVMTLYYLTSSDYRKVQQSKICKSWIHNNQCLSQNVWEIWTIPFQYTNVECIIMSVLYEKSGLFHFTRRILVKREARFHRVSILRQCTNGCINILFSSWNTHFCHLKMLILSHTPKKGGKVDDSMLLSPTLFAGHNISNIPVLYVFPYTTVKAVRRLGNKLYVAWRDACSANHLTRIVWRINGTLNMFLSNSSATPPPVLMEKEKESIFFSW